MEPCGYAGNILHINLTDNQFRKEPLDPELSKKFLGGWGINHKLYYDLISPCIEPLSPDNPLIVGTGPFGGTMIPAGTRTYITYKHPLSGTIGSAPGTGVFSYMLKSAGYDHIVITGKARNPVYLRISEYRAELCDASELWGKDAYDTVFALRRKYEPCSVIAMGPAGENLVNISVAHIDSAQGALGQGGMPAVMGSKNLKAIVAVQGMRPVKVAHPHRLQKSIDGVLERVRTYPRLSGMREGGGWYMMRGGIGGMETPSVKEQMEREALAFEMHKRSRTNIACVCCPVACRERIDLSEGEYAGLTSYHVMTRGGVLEMHGVGLNYNRLVKFNDTMNRYGVDRMFLGGILDVLFTLYENGTITRHDIGGLELKRDFETILKIARMVAYREGFGDVIADGVVNVCNRLGLDPERDAVHIKGWNRVIVPSRITHVGTTTISMLVEPRGPTGSAGATSPPSYQLGEPVDRWVRYARQQGLPKEAEERIFTATSFNPARLLKWMHSYHSILQSMGFCGRLYITRFHDLATMTEYYSALTGIKVTPAELLKKGERNWNLLKVLNIREGFSREDDRPPESWFKPPRGGGTELIRKDIEKLLDDYYDESGWNRETTAPTPEKLRELDLEEIKS